MKPRVKTHEEFLRALHYLKPQYQKVLLKICNEDEINSICECIYNVLQGEIPLQKQQKNKLLKYKGILRKLISKGKNKSRRNIIIQKGGAFLPIILGSVLSTILGSLIK